MTDNQQARQHVENANAAILFSRFDPFADKAAHVPVPGFETPARWSDGSYERHQRMTDDQAREVEAPDDDERPVLIVRRRAWMGEVA